MYRKIFTLVLILIAGIITDAGFTQLRADSPQEVIVYPNPVIDGNLQVSSDLKMQKIEVMSITGEIVYQQELEPANRVALRFDLKAGLYLIRVTFADNTSNTKRIWVN